MANFLVEITTPAKKAPRSRGEDVTERALIQRALLQIVDAVSNCSAYHGNVNTDAYATDVAAAMSGISFNASATFAYTIDGKPAGFGFVPGVKAA